tara:strand:+ start:840 stop:1049 length:210 start_codon:yes stop_codon:yes gene_type:complete
MQEIAFGENPIEEIKSESFSIKKESLYILNLPSSLLMAFLLKLDEIAANGIGCLFKLSITIPDISWQYR